MNAQYTSRVTLNDYMIHCWCLLSNTLAFPFVQLAVAKCNPLGVVLLPTRELALQVFTACLHSNNQIKKNAVNSISFSSPHAKVHSVARSLRNGLGVQSTCLYGGADKDTQLRTLTDEVRNTHSLSIAFIKSLVFSISHKTGGEIDKPRIAYMQ